MPYPARADIRRVEQHVRVKEHHGSRVIRRSCSHERSMFSGERSIASRHASRLISGTSFARCRRTRTNRSSPRRWTSKTSPGLAPGMTTRLLVSARTAFMSGNFPVVTASVKSTMAPRRVETDTSGREAVAIERDGERDGRARALSPTTIRFLGHRPARTEATAPQVGREYVEAAVGGRLMGGVRPEPMDGGEDWGVDLWCLESAISVYDQADRPAPNGDEDEALGRSDGSGWSASSTRSPAATRWGRCAG